MATLTKSGLPDSHPLCTAAPNDVPLSYVDDAGVYQLNKWVSTGIAAPAAPRITANSSGAVVRDAYGNALGGIRTPYVDVPVATETGYGNFPNGQPQSFFNGFFCFLIGTKTPFSSSQLAALYPNHGSYVSQVAADTNQAVANGFVLPFDGSQIVSSAAQSSVGK
jgi:hypothetical protein